MNRRASHRPRGRGPGASESGETSDSPRGRAAAEDERRGPSRFLAPTISVLLAAALLALLVFGIFSQSPNTTIDDSLAKKQPVPAPAYRLRVLLPGTLGRVLGSKLAGPLADGWISPAELRGTPYVLNVWASWCVPCREEAPRLERTWRTARSRGVLFLGLDQQDVTDDARAFMREFRIDYMNIRDPTNDVPRAYGATGVPETYFVSARGFVVTHVIGVVTSADLRRGIAAAVATDVSAPRQGGARRPSR